MFSRVFKVILVLPLFLSFAFAEELISKQANVKVLQAPKLKAKAVAKLKKGTKLEGLAKKGLFWKVKTSDGKEGFVMITKVQSAHQKGAKKLFTAMRSVLNEKKRAKAGSGRARAKNAVMGIRGLSDGDDLSNVGNLRPNLRALEALEGLEVNPKSLGKIQNSVLKEADERNRS